MPSYTPVIAQMQALIHQWDETEDDKVLFLRCYLMMTENMLAAIDRQEFNDSIWVNRLLNHFAGYYFMALEAFEDNPALSPAVWQAAHRAAGDPQVTAIQKLLLGVNAHINYDLVLTLADLLQTEWESHSEGQRAGRYADHCRVNEVIGRTIDAVQDQVIEPAMPVMDMVDRLLGPVDEMLLSRMIAHWRENVWRNATRLLELRDIQQQGLFIRNVEEEALETGKLICNRSSLWKTGGL